MYFPLCFIILLRQLRRLYTGGFIFQVPPVYNYSTCYTSHMLMRLVRQIHVYAFGTPNTRLCVWCTNYRLRVAAPTTVYKALTN